MEKNNYYLLCSIFEHKYTKLMLERKEFAGMDATRIRIFIFPEGWDDSIMHQRKIEILIMAIEKNANIRELPEAIEFSEGVFQPSDINPGNSNTL